MFESVPNPIKVLKALIHQQLCTVIEQQLPQAISQRLTRLSSSDQEELCNLLVWFTAHKDIERISGVAGK